VLDLAHPVASKLTASLASACRAKKTAREILSVAFEAQVAAAVFGAAAFWLVGHGA
jgi:hypothetical protein